MPPYQNYYPTMNNPYMDRMNFLQGYQQNYQQPQVQNFINGKVVDSIEVVKATDIPMDGQNYYFPKADGSELYVKKWNNNGTTSVTTYKPILDDLEQKADNVSQNDINEQISAISERTDVYLKSIDDRLSKIEKSFANAKKNLRTQKESDEC